MVDVMAGEMDDSSAENSERNSAEQWDCSD